MFLTQIIQTFLIVNLFGLKELHWSFLLPSLCFKIIVLDLLNNNNTIMIFNSGLIVNRFGRLYCPNFTSEFGKFISLRFITDGYILSLIPKPKCLSLNF